MEKHVIIRSIAMYFLGCKSVKDFFFKKEANEAQILGASRRTLLGKVAQNPDGSWTVNLNQAIK